MPNNNQANGAEIANPSVGQPKGPQMNDRDMMNDVLAMQKYLTDNFNVAAREASHNQFHQDVMRILTETHQAARDAYNLMFQKGWYKLEAAEAQQIQQAVQQFTTYQNEQMPRQVH